MSYFSTLRGYITATPPLTHAEIVDSPYRSRGYADEQRHLVWVDAEEFSMDTPEGKLTGFKAEGIRTSAADELRADGLRDEVEEIVNAFAVAPGGEPRRFFGEIRVYGDDSPDIWRVKVTPDGGVTQERPKLVWPDGVEQLADRSA